MVDISLILEILDTHRFLVSLGSGVIYDVSVPLQRGNFCMFDLDKSEFNHGTCITENFSIFEFGLCLGCRVNVHSYEIRGGQRFEAIITMVIGVDQRRVVHEHDELSIWE
jgi:hypothetical protein